MSKINEDVIYFAKLNSDAKIPSKKDEDAGYDLYACFEEDFFVIEPHQTRPIPTGIAGAFSSKFYAQVEERSSLGKLGIKKNAGVIDSGYRGEYLILTYNTNDRPFIISKIDANQIATELIIGEKKYKKEEVIFYPFNKAICQLILHEIPKLKTKEISYEELLNFSSERGTGGFGSSGK